MDEMQRLTEEEPAAWERFVAVLELLPAALDAQLAADANLTFFEYFCLKTLADAPERKLRVSALAAHTNATLPRISRVVRRLEKRGLVGRATCPHDGRATNVSLTEEGWEKVAQAAPRQMGTVRKLVLDALEPEQVGQLSDISAALLSRLDPDGRLPVTSQCAEAA